MPVVSDTAADLLPRVALATQVVLETAREHGLQLNMASNKTEAVVDFRGRGRQQVLEELAVEFPVVDGQWTPNRQGRGWRLAQIGKHVSALGNTGLSWGKARSGARSSSFRRKSGVPSHAQEDPESEASFQESQGGGRPRGCQLPFAPWGWYVAFPQHFGRINAMEDTYMAPFRTIANERWRPGYDPASSQEVCRRLGNLDFWEAVSMQRLRLAARLVNASLSLMALLQSDAGRAWKAELFCDIEVLRREKGPQLVEVEGLPDFEKLWCEFSKAWKLLVSVVPAEARGTSSAVGTCAACSRSRSSDPTFGCDECEAVHKKLRALRSHQMRAHQRRREARRYVLDSISVCKADFRSRPRVIQHLEVGAKRCVLAWKSGALEPFPDDGVAAADQQVSADRGQCKREGRSHLARPPMLRGGAEGQ